jgi:hypothetical protein
MSQNNSARLTASQNVTSLPDGKIIVSRQQLREILSLLSLATPLFSSPKPPERQWSAVKTMKLVRAKKLLRRALADENNQGLKHD